MTNGRQWRGPVPLVIGKFQRQLEESFYVQFVFTGSYPVRGVVSRQPCLQGPLVFIERNALSDGALHAFAAYRIFDG